jgi:hypothetical protein
VNGAVFLIFFSACSLLVYRKATGFHILILCSDMFLKVFIRSRSFFFFGRIFRVF